MGEYHLSWFQVLRYRKSGYVLYGHGTAVGHIMDWRGCNFMHGRLVTRDGVRTPVFPTPIAALEWLRDELRAGTFEKALSGWQIMPGHHAGEYECSMGCDERVVDGRPSGEDLSAVSHYTLVPDKKYVLTDTDRARMWKRYVLTSEQEMEAQAEESLSSSVTKSEV